MPAYKSLDEAFSSVTEIEAVVLCTPPKVHYAQGREALLAGRHVFLEKPPTASLSEIVSLEGLAQELQERWSRSHVLDDLRDAARRTREEADARLEALTMPDLPSLEELEARAREMFNDSPSLEEIAQRAREMVLEALSAYLLDSGLETA